MVRAELEQVETATLAKLTRLKNELIALGQAAVREEYKQVAGRYEAELEKLSVVHRQRKAARAQQRAEYVEHLRGEALALALAGLAHESQQNSGERRALKQKRNEAIAPLAQSVAEADKQIRTLKQQYAVLSNGWKQQMQAAYFSKLDAELAHGKRAVLNVLYEDAGLIVVDKPAGLLSVPGRRLHLQDSVLGRLRYQMRDQMPASDFLQAVHRLDRDTSGVMAIALSATVHAELSQQFAQRQVHKRYEAILSRPVNCNHGTVALPLWSCPECRPRQMVDTKRGKPSETGFRVLSGGEQPRIEFVPYTGRTHQLRLHAAHPDGLNSPILGDVLYGIEDYARDGDGNDSCDCLSKRLFLHAKSLKFVHPKTQRPITFESQTPF